MANYDASVRVNTQVDTAQMQKLQIQVDKTTHKVSTLAKELEELKNKKIPTTEYVELEKKLKAAQADLQRLNEQKKEYASLGFGEAELAGVNRQISDAKSKIEQITASMQKMTAEGKAFTLGASQDEITEKARQLSLAQAEQRAAVTKQQEAYEKMSKSAKKCFKVLHADTKKSSGLFSQMASRLKGIALSLLVFNWITKGFNAMVSAMKEGFQNLAQYSNDYNEQMSALKSSAAETKNALAAAFEPVVNTVIPYLVQMIQWLNIAIDTIGQFFAALKGSNTYTKASKQTINYGKALDSASKSAKRALASFDELNVISESGGGGGSAGGEKTGADAFETGQVDSKIIDAVDRIKAIMKPFIDSISKWWNELNFEPLLASFERLKVACEPLLGYIFEGLQFFLDEILLPLGSWVIEDGLPVFLDMLAVGLEFLCSVIEAIKPGLAYIWDNIFVPMGEFTGELFIQAIELIKNGVSQLAELLSSKSGEISTILTVLGEAFKNIWVNYIKPQLDFIMGAASELVSYLVNIVEDIIDILGGIIDFIAGVFTGDWEKAWGGLVDIFKGIVNGIIDIFEGVVNTIISGMNNLSFDVPDWIPEIGGSKFGFDLQKLELPRLANGAVIQGGRPFAAILGDQRFGQTNIETPLNTMVEAFKQAMREGNGGMAGEITIVAQLDGKTLFKETVRQDQIFRKSTGVSAFG